MADIENSAEMSSEVTSNINENFNTIKTLLNSIRAQGILNTSDVDKLLTGINSKLEKINTEEDIDLIKIFLSELKQNLDERHNVLLSKFGAIESLFSNLLKNSNELPKSAELKELFDIVATNLSVFSREVVSQKESLTDIALKIDAFRSDDSDKKDIIKNITLLKPDLERMSNGFDSIVLSLNDNFKTIVKTITSIDKTEHLDKFADALSNIEMSSNTVLSALQMLDKKTEKVDEALQNVLTKDDITSTNQKLFELTAQSQELNNSVSELSDKYSRIDNLADKIDASVNIIAGLKSVLEETDDKNTKLILEDLKALEEQTGKITSEIGFEEFKTSLEHALSDIIERISLLDSNFKISIGEVNNVISIIKSLDINVNIQSLQTSLNGAENNIKSHISEISDKINTLNEANITRVLNDLSACAESLSGRLNNAQSEIAVLCEKNFTNVADNISELKNVLSQIDENGIAANNAIFSNITDRLSVFENELHALSENQERSVTETSGNLIDKIENLKNIFNVLDYKLDSSVVEIGNTKREFENLKSSVDSVLALDFVSTVKDLRADLYAAKQEMTNAFEASENDLSEKVSNDLYSKYELLISKLDSVEDELKKVQITSLAEFKPILDKISESLVDVLSYVSESKVENTGVLDSKLNDITNIVKETNMNYVESVRDIVDVIRQQVETNLRNISEDAERRYDLIKEKAEQNAEVLKTAIESNLTVISEALNTNSVDIKNDIKYSYSKLLEIQDLYEGLKNLLNVNEMNSSNKFETVISATDTLRSDFGSEIAALRNSMLEKISDFKQEFFSNSAEGVSGLKTEFAEISSANKENIKSAISELKEQIEKFESETSSARTSVLAKILDNFVNLKEYAASLNDKYTDSLTQKTDELINDFEHVREILNKVDENVDADMTRQLSIIESNFETLVSQITILFEKSDKDLSDRINDEFSDISEKMQDIVTEKLEGYKYKIEETFDNLQKKAEAQTDYLQDRISNLNTLLKETWEEQAKDNIKQIDDISAKLENILKENLKMSEIDYLSLKDRLNEFTEEINVNNKNIIEDLKTQLDDITKYVDSVLGVQAQDIISKHDELTELIKNNADESVSANTEIKEALSSQNSQLLTASADLSGLKSIVAENRALLNDLDTSISEKTEALKSLSTELSTNELASVENYFAILKEQVELQIQAVQSVKDLIVEAVKADLKLVSGDIEKETDTVLAELIEQFDLLKKAQADDVISLSNRIEEIISSKVYENIEDLKSYLDVKTDTAVFSDKLDNLKNEMTASLGNVISDLSRLLDSGVFNSAISDFRLANEILVNSAVDRMNDKVETFINENIKTIADVLTEDSNKIEEKLALFDKKFSDTVVDKFEEIKVISNAYNKSLGDIQGYINGVASELGGVKETLADRVEELADEIKKSAEATNFEIQNLNKCFDNLRSQISSKSFDEAFQTSINKQIGNLEDLINEQLGYIEDINELCSASLPDFTELNTLVKGSLIETVNTFAEKFNNQDIEGKIESELKQLKSDIITQILNVFNQISFVTEQEEILDFIQDKHDELIGVLSRIVPAADKINSIKADIEHINDKINAIISSDGDVDYIYSLQDLESDIANLRLVLNEMKEHSESQEFSELVNSTNDIYKLVESIKTELPSREDFNGIAEDIVSISSRTNKLILSSEESYKMLQDNLNEFKLVVDDLDERTRNFARESGIDKVNAKLNSLNEMMQNGSKTNQVFNQVFEYLAEWVDKAGDQINTIADKVESLEEIGQIKDILIGLKASSDESANEDELAEALGLIFDKQNKRMSSIETKLDKLIVSDTVKKKSKNEISPLEATLNKFLVAIDEKITAQEEKIGSLESALSEVMGLLEEKDTAQLTKKVGGMDRQIAKLNKSIEKIASHVVEK